MQLWLGSIHSRHSCRRLVDAANFAVSADTAHGANDAVGLDAELAHVGEVADVLHRVGVLKTTATCLVQVQQHRIMRVRYSAL